MLETGQEVSNPLVPLLFVGSPIFYDHMTWLSKCVHLILLFKLSWQQSTAFVQWWMCLGYQSSGSMHTLVTWEPSGKIEAQSSGIVFPDSKVHGANMGLIWADRTQVGPMLAPWTLLSGLLCMVWPKNAHCLHFTDFVVFSNCFIFPISFRVSSLVLGQSHNCPVRQPWWIRVSISHKSCWTH